MNNPYVFISYSTVETDVASKVWDYLRANGVNCWMAPQCIQGGSDYTRSIPDAISNCDAFIVVCSENSQNSYWVKSEIIEAITCHRAIIPFIIDDFPMTKEFNFLLSPFQRIPEYQHKENAYPMLLNAVLETFNSIKKVEVVPEVVPEVIPIEEKTKSQDDDPTQGSTLASDTNDNPTQRIIKKNKTPSKKETKKLPPAKKLQETAKVELSPIRFFPNLLLWLFFFANVIFCIVQPITIRYHQEYQTIYNFIFFIALLMLILSEVFMLILKRDKVRTYREINGTRRLIVSINIFFSVLIHLVVLLTYSIDNQINAEHPIGALSAYLLLLFIIYAVLTIICFIRFKKDKSFLWFHNTNSTNNEYSTLPNILIISIYLINFYFTLFENVYFNRSSKSVPMLNYSFLFCTLLIITTLICKAIVKRHKSADKKHITFSIWILTILNLAYTVFSYIFIAISDGFVMSHSGYSYTDPAQSSVLVITGAVILIISIAYTIVFRRLKYVYKNNTPPSA